MIDKRALEGRLDPYYYANQHNKITSKIYPNVLLHKIAFLQKGQSITKNTIERGTFPVIAGGQSSPYTHIKYNYENAITVSASGAYAGYVWYHNYKFFASDCTVIQSKNEKLVATKFLAEILKLKQSEIYTLQQGAAQPHVYASDLSNLQIPLPPLPVQQQIVQLFEAAYQAKQQKEAQAKALLAGIDAYLLQMLGIQLPAPQAPQTVFFTPFSKTAGGRLDPFYYSNRNFKIQGGIYPYKLLIEVAKLMKGQSITKEGITQGLYPVIAGGQSSPYSHNTFNYLGNIITVSASGAYSGYVWYHHSPIFASDCIVINSKNEVEITTIFLFEVLKLKQKEIYNLQQGAGQPHVYADDLAKLQIPLPPLDVQNQIADAISAMRAQAYQLEAEADAGISAARAEIERLILG